jgi:hypothetical protein
MNKRQIKKWSKQRAKILQKRIVNKTHKKIKRKFHEKGI